MDEMYYVIVNGEGDTTIRAYTKQQLLLEMEEEGAFHEGIFDNFPVECDTNYWAGKSLIIKGTVVSPQAEQIITKFKID